MSGNGAVVDDILCRVDVGNALWVLVRYESQQEETWQKFNNVAEMRDFIKDKGRLNLECPQRCLTPDQSNKTIGDLKRKIAGLEKELHTCKALLSKSGPPLASPLATTSTLQNRVTTGTVQSSGESSSSTSNNTAGAVGPIGAKLGSTYPAALQNSFTTGMKRSASVLSVPSSGNNSEAESSLPGGARKLSKNASRIARSTSVSNMSSSVGAVPRATPTLPTGNTNTSGTKSTAGIDLRRALQAMPRKASIMDTLDPYHSDNSADPRVNNNGTGTCNGTGTGTAHSSQANTPREHLGTAPRGARESAEGSGGSAGSVRGGGDSGDECSYRTESDSSAYNRHRDLECSVDTDDVGYGSESSVTVTSGPNSTTKPVNGINNGSSGSGSSRGMVGIALSGDPALPTTSTTTSHTTASNKHALRRSQSVESVNSAHSNHSANSVNSANSVRSANSTGSTTSTRRLRAPAPNTSYPITSTSTSASNGPATNAYAYNTHTTSVEDDSRMSLRLSQDDEESRSMLFAGMQDQSRTFTYTKNSSDIGSGTGTSGAGGAGGATSGGGSGSGSGSGSGGLFGMVMSFASNYVTKYLTPSQLERERQKELLGRERALHATNTATPNTTSSLPSNTNSNINNNNNMDSSATYSQGEDSCIMEYTRDATYFPHYNTTTTTTTANTTSNGANNTNNTTSTAAFSELPVLHTETPSHQLPVFDPYNEDSQSTQGTQNTLQTLLTHDSATEAVEEVVEEVALVPVDWNRIPIETQQALSVFQKAIQKSALSPALQCTLLRGIVTKEMTPVECANQLCAHLRYALRTATAASRTQQLEVAAKLTKLLQKFTVRNKKLQISTSDALGVKTVAACCIIQICTNMQYYSANEAYLRDVSTSARSKADKGVGKSAGAGNVKDSYTEAVSSSIDRLVLMLTSPVIAKEDVQWLLTATTPTNTTSTTSRATTHNSNTNTHSAYSTYNAYSTYSTYDPYPSSPPPQEKAPIEVFVHYLKDKYSDTAVWSNVRECLLRYDYTYQRYLVSPVKVVPEVVKARKSKTAALVVPLLDIATSGTGCGTTGTGGGSSSDFVNQVASQVLPPRGRADSLKTATSASTSVNSSTTATAPVSLKRQSSLIGDLLQQTRSKLRGESSIAADALSTSSGGSAGGSGDIMSSAQSVPVGVSAATVSSRVTNNKAVATTTANATANNTSNTNDTNAPAVPARRPLVTKKAPLVGHRMGMGAQRNVVISAKTLAANAAASAASAAAALQVPAAKPKPVSLFQASEFAKTPNKTRSITFSQGMGDLAGHATPVSSQLDDFSFSTQRGARSGTRGAGSGGSARRTVVENTPMEALQSRRAGASRRGYLSGGVGYMSSPSPEGASARRRSRAHRDHVEDNGRSVGSVNSGGSSGSGGSGSGSGGRSRHNRLSNFFATQDDTEDSDHLLEHSLEHSLAPPRRRHLGHTEVRAVGVGEDFVSSQEAQSQEVLGAPGTPDAYRCDAFGSSRPHPLGSFLDGSAYHSLRGGVEEEEEER